MNNNKLQCLIFSFQNQELGHLNMLIAKEKIAYFDMQQNHLMVVPAIKSKDTIKDILNYKIKYNERFAEATYRNHLVCPNTATLKWLSININCKKKNLGRETIHGIIQDIRGNGCNSLQGGATESSASYYRKLGFEVDQDLRFFTSTDNPLFAPTDKFVLEEEHSAWATEILNEKGHLY